MCIGKTADVARKGTIAKNGTTFKPQLGLKTLVNNYATTKGISSMQGAECCSTAYKRNRGWVSNQNCHVGMWV
jgi:hypothetical protein